jgi:predicted metal-dependent enzyme (double-stranded beta helix superfamily)
VDEPVRTFFDKIAGVTDPEAVASLLAELAADEDYFAHLIAPIDPEQMGGLPMHVPDEGPRMFLMHRPRGVMSYVHSHGTWAAVAPVSGVETHLRYDVVEETGAGSREARRRGRTQARARPSGRRDPAE